MGEYKTYVNNKARPEGSIAKAYIVNESLTFCSMYLRRTETKFNRNERNGDGGEQAERISVFSQNARSFGKLMSKELSCQEIDRVHWYSLNNCEEVQPYLDEYMILLQSEGITTLSERQQRFPKWFASHIKQLRNQGDVVVSDQLYSLAYGPDVRVFSFSGYNVNGV